MHGLTDGRCLHQPRQTQNKRTHTKRRPPLSGLAWHCPQRVVIGCGQLIVIQKKEGEAQRKSCRQTSSAESAPSLSITSPQSLYPFSSRCFVPVLAPLCHFFYTHSLLQSNKLNQYIHYPHNGQEKDQDGPSTTKQDRQ